jgi:hypothetical protein
MSESITYSCDIETREKLIDFLNSHRMFLTFVERRTEPPGINIIGRPVGIGNHSPYIHYVDNWYFPIFSNGPKKIIFNRHDVKKILLEDAINRKKMSIN